MKLSIETNAYRAFVDGDPVFVQAIQQAELVSFSVVVLGELRAGFAHGTRRTENERILSQVLAAKRVVVHDVGDSTSAVCARVWSEQRSKGLPIPTNDVWIAAQRLEMDYALITRDAHFRSIAGLVVYP